MALAPIWTPYCGPAPQPDGWLARWNLDPPLLVAGALLVAGLVHLHRRGRVRPAPAAAASLLLAALFVSPLCALASALFSARVVHDVVLMAVVAPLVVLALPRRQRVLPGSLALWTAAQTVVFWAWHAPPLYAAALSADAVYWLMQASLFAAGVGFWTAVRRAAPPAAAAALLVTVVQTGLLGALLVSATSALYAPHLGTTSAWGLTPLEDQQLAGLVMWAPAAGLYLAAALAILGRWLARQADPVARPA